MDLKSNTGEYNRFWITFGYLLTIYLLFAQYNLAISLYSPRNILWSLVFMTTSYAELMVLFSCLRKHEHLTVDAPTEDRSYRLKRLVWILCFLVTCPFTWRISQTVPWYMNIIIWGMSVSLLVVEFYFFFLFQSEDAQLANKICKLDTDHKEENKFCELSPEDKGLSRFC
ncbi:hypothetical protein FCM35_KLT08530 [Carex littledalei]|uniref:Uncharacterized protein n=1 Tax=Carex littledalei TaxID=544730 RepID=A0A833QJB2_9POAL|nr:hypothetical protein FCM35_KLT08530 [Carex littledalei]